MKCLPGLLLLLLFASVAKSQSLNLQAAETAFLKNNLSLLAEQFNIDASRAAVIQARLWENPYFSADFNAVNPERSKVFDAGRQGQKALAIQQLIYLGGKKKAEVEFAKTNAQAAELALKDLLRNLRFQLRNSYFEVYYSSVSAAAFEKQLSNLDSLTQAYNVQAQKGNVPLKDVVRLQALYLDLKSEHTLLLNNIAEEQSKLSTIIGAAELTVPTPTPEEINAYQKTLDQDTDQLLNAALLNRSDILFAEKSIQAARDNLKWQKALSVPDLTVGAGYDQRGGAFNNQVNLTLGVPLRLWNRNQGNVKIANIRVGQSTTEKQFLQLQVQNEVAAAIKKYSVARNNYDALQREMYRNLDIVYTGVLQNFQRRNISIIEFTDFMESYYKSVIRFNETRKSLILSAEEINYVTGTPVF